MIIRSVRVRNFRCIRDATLTCSCLTALVGANGSGKSSFLHALDVFYAPAAEYSEEDFYGRNTAEPITITVTFTELSSQERQRFAPYLESGELTVEKVVTYPRTRVSQRYYGTRLANADFQPVYSAATATEKLRLYRELRETAEYGGLPACRSEAQAREALAAWEAAHPERLQRLRDDGQFFGFREVGEAELERDTRFVLVRAVREASEEASETRGAALGLLMDLVVRATLSQRQEIASFRDSVQEGYEKLVDPENLPELKQLESNLTTTLQHFAPDTAVVLEWQEQTVNVPLPTALPWLIEDGFRARVDRTGHGSQRAFILTLLQHLEAARPTRTTEEEMEEGRPAEREVLPGLILAIEEPELYQHPSRQRNLARVLHALAEGRIPGVAARTQVIYSTHSPLFVSVQAFDRIRVLRKVADEPELAKETRVYACTLAEVARKLNACRPAGLEPLPEAALPAILRSLMTPQGNEAFFAKAVGLVEGLNDHALLVAYAQAQGINLDARDVCILCCNSKNAMPAAFAVLTGLSIPVYLVFDADKGNPNAPKLNRQLLSMLRLPQEDYPVGICDQYAAFDKDMEECVIRETRGELRDEVKRWAQQQDVSEERARRNQACLDDSFRACLARGTDCSSLGQICGRLASMAENTA